jgi:hypothetical protein
MHRPTGAGDQQVDLDAPHPRFLRVLTALPQMGRGPAGSVPSPESESCAQAPRNPIGGVSIPQMTRCQVEVRPDGHVPQPDTAASWVATASSPSSSSACVQVVRSQAAWTNASVGAVPGVATARRQYRLGRLPQGTAHSCHIATRPVAVPGASCALERCRGDAFSAAPPSQEARRMIRRLVPLVTSAEPRDGLHSVLPPSGPWSMHLSYNRDIPGCIESTPSSAGCDRVFRETASRVPSDRPALQRIAMADPARAVAATGWPRLAMTTQTPSGTVKYFVASLTPFEDGTMVNGWSLRPTILKRARPPAIS